MKENYQNAEMEVLEFSVADVISTSDAIRDFPTIPSDRLPTEPTGDIWN